MFKFSQILGVIALAGAVQFASAQDADAYVDSYSQFSATLDTDVTSAFSSGPNFSGPYNFGGLPATTTGISYNTPAYYNQKPSFDANGNVIGGSNEASTESEAFGNGSAYQNQGVAYFVDFTNTSKTTAENISFTEDVFENLSAYTDGTPGAYAKSVAYGGFSYFNGATGIYTTGFFTNSLDSNGSTTGPDDFGVATPQTPNFMFTGTGPGYAQGEATQTISLVANQTVTIEFWASGSTTAAVPEPPVALLGFAGLGVLLLRRKSA